MLPVTTIRGTIDVANDEDVSSVVMADHPANLKEVTFVTSKTSRKTTPEARDARPGALDPKIGVLVVAYNAASTLEAVLDRIPKGFAEEIDRIYVNDDHSQDSTYLVGIGYHSQNPQLPLVITRHPENLGYGGNQKAGYLQAIEDGLDVIVLLHGDGQYAPELLTEMVAPIIEGRADAVFGSRMMHPGGARAGGMPLYKYLGNKVLTKFENAMLGSSLTEFHSGYRAYRVETLKKLPFAKNSDGFDFDTEIIIQLHAGGHRIVEIPIPTYYGDEICYVNGMNYAWEVTKDVIKFRLSEMGIGEPALPLPERYEPKLEAGTSHRVLSDWLRQKGPGRVLDLGCAGGYVAESARAAGHHVIGVDLEEASGVRSRVDQFVCANLEIGVPDSVSGPFETIVMGDVLEHVADSQRLLASAAERLGPEGEILLSVPNFGHWYPRLRTVFGVFDYDERGILDRGHLRFFTRRSLDSVLGKAGMRVIERRAVGIPQERLRGGRGLLGRLAQWVETFGLRVRPTLFAYQWVYRVGPLLKKSSRSETKLEVA